MLDEGITRRSISNPDPPLHIVVGNGAVWCSGAEAVRLNTMLRRRCAECTALLREGVADGNFDQEELDDWLRVTRPTGYRLGKGTR